MIEFTTEELEWIVIIALHYEETVFYDDQIKKILISIKEKIEAENE